MVNFEVFRPTLLKTRNPSPQGGRPPHDEVVMFKILVLQRLYQLSDDAMEFQLYDRKSFLTFVGIKDGDTIPNAKTIWSFRNALATAGLDQELFKTFDVLLQGQGYHARSGQILDAEIIEVRRPRSQKEEAYETPAAKAQVDRDASYTKKRKETYFGYKNHVSIDRRHKFVRVYNVETAAPHDSQFFEPLLDPSNSSLDLWADSAYKSQEIDGICENKAYRNHIHHRAYITVNRGAQSVAMTSLLGFPIPIPTSDFDLLHGVVKNLLVTGLRLTAMSWRVLMYTPVTHKLFSSPEPKFLV